MLTDAHCHLDFYGDPEEPILKARDAGVELIVTVGYTLASCVKAIQLAEGFPFVYAGIGIHPWEAAPIDEETYRRLTELARHPKAVCISEIGLDYTYTHNPQTKKAQQEFHRQQIRLAREMNLPVMTHNAPTSEEELEKLQQEILRQQIRLARDMNLPLNTHHDRASEEDLIQIFRAERAAEIGGIIHGFQGDLEYAQKCLDMGFYLSFGRLLLRPEGEYLHDVVRWAPRDRLVVETDSAGAAGTSPAEVALVAERLGQLLNLSPEAAANITAANLKRALKV